MTYIISCSYQDNFAKNYVTRLSYLCILQRDHVRKWNNVMKEDIGLCIQGAHCLAMSFKSSHVEQQMPTHNMGAEEIFNKLHLSSVHHMLNLRLVSAKTSLIMSLCNVKD